MSDDTSVLIINRTDVRRLLTWPALLEATRHALVSASNAKGAAAALSSQLVLPQASLHLKVGAQTLPPTLSVKANLRPNAGRAAGAILAFDLKDEQLHAILASADLTAMRTAAIAAVAAQTLMVRRPARLALLGAGPVAQRVYEVLTHLGIVSGATVWSRDVARAQALLHGAADTVDASATDDVKAALTDADLVVTCTPSQAPLFEAVDLQSDALVLAMGADTAGKRELPHAVLEAASVYTDVRDDALNVGECAYLDAAQASRVRDLGSLLASSNVVPSPPGWTVFDSVGSSAVDVAAVALVVAQAEKVGLGQRVHLNA